MNKFSKLFMYLQLGLATVQAVRSVETSVTDPKAGPAKLDIVVGTVAAASQAVPEIASEIKAKDAASFATTVANTTVTALNAAGVFKKS